MNKEKSTKRNIKQRINEKRKDNETPTNAKTLCGVTVVCGVWDFAPACVLADTTVARNPHTRHSVIVGFKF